MKENPPGTLDINTIARHLPHRYPFLLVDRIVEIEGQERIVGIKNVTVNEQFFNGHFPGRPVMPGVLICEAMAQVGAILAHTARGSSSNDKIFLLTGLDNVKFKRPVEPGDQLRLELTSLKRRGFFWKMRGTATVEGKLVAHADISAMEVEMV
jgi:beta-hydroxyacyl-ACP dehydratase FabZ